MKTIKLNINCSDETCHKCRYLMGKFHTWQYCALYEKALEVVGENFNTDYYRCKKCKEAEIKGGD